MSELQATDVLPTSETLDHSSATEDSASENATSSDGSVKRVKDFTEVLAPYRAGGRWRSVVQLTVSSLLFVACWAASYWCYAISPWLTLCWTFPIGMLIVKLFCIMHDCGHGSYFKSRRANEVTGFILGVLTFSPYDHWRKAHAAHHATSGKLERRGVGGEIRMMTVREYREATPRQRLGYRLYRNPLLLFGFGPSWYFLIANRFTWGLPKQSKAERASIHQTNLCLFAVIGLACWLFGWREFLMVHMLSMVLASSVGVWLFYVQHQYEEAYWEGQSDWNYVDAALLGSSYYRLPWVMQWLTASIGLHHIHHLDHNIPNYRLQRCHDENKQLQQVPTLTFWQSLHCSRLKLWEEETNRLVSFAEAK